ncbi:hypothetical protein BKD26_04890 [Streptomyces sp. CB03238]|nr:hypothetical protein BKD26_04890 [Streptomyces sp. CB03238]
MTANVERAPVLGFFGAAVMLLVPTRVTPDSVVATVVAVTLSAPPLLSTAVCTAAGNVSGRVRDQLPFASVIAVPRSGRLTVESSSGMRSAASTRTFIPTAGVPFGSRNLPETTSGPVGGSDGVGAAGTGGTSESSTGWPK